MRKLQAQIEQSKQDIKVKRIGAATGEANESRKIASASASAILKSVRADEQEAGKQLLKDIDEQMGVAVVALGEQNGQGSVQERSALDRSFEAESNAATMVSRLEELMVPASFDVVIPDEYVHACAAARKCRRPPPGRARVPRLLTTSTRTHRLIPAPPHPARARRPNAALALPGTKSCRS